MLIAVSSPQSFKAFGSFILIFSWLEAYPSATLQHYKRIADYLEVGEGIWFRSTEEYIEFLMEIIVQTV